MQLTQIEFTSFSYIDLKQIFTMSAVQATDSEISPCTPARNDSKWMSITHYDWPYSAMTGCLNHLPCRCELKRKMKNV